MLVTNVSYATHEVIEKNYVLSLPCKMPWVVYKEYSGRKVKMSS